MGNRIKAPSIHDIDIYLEVKAPCTVREPLSALLYTTMTDPTSKLSLPDVPDILCQVFSYLDPIHYSGERMYEVRQSLATAARTCRGFTGPALDILWKRLPDDQPLSDLLCTLGIAAREVGRDDIQVLQVGANNLRRDQLPRPDGPEHWPPPVLEALARSWKLWRGYDIRYVSV